MADKKNWKDMNKGERITGVVIVILAILFVFWIVSSIGSGQKASEQEKSELVQQVNTEISKLDGDMKKTIASTSAGGYQGDIMSVEPGMSTGEVKVNVSTYFKDPGNEQDGGKNIARTIFNMICSDVPELKSLYVTSGRGLDSQSIYRSESICK